MNVIMKKVFYYGKPLIASGLLVFLILLGTAEVQAKANHRPYLIKVNRYYNTITVYEKDDTGCYSLPIKAIACSVGRKGAETKLGTFQTKEKYRWKLLMGDVWGQYSTRIVGGILFHSVYYYGKCNPSTLAVNEYNKLGTAASHGCIRINVQDAKWIYDHCPIGTTVVIYDDKKSPGPLGKPETIKIPTNIRWDPTDPNDKNPYNGKKPSIRGAKNRTLQWGEEVDLLAGIYAKSSLGADITKKLKVDGDYNIYKAGDYRITYTITDILGRTSKKSVTMTVKESDKKPVIDGISDRVLSEDTEITRELALSGVEAYCGDILLDQDEINVKIEENGEDYLIYYKISIGKKVSSSWKAVFHIDKTAPVFEGVSDRILIPEQIPDQDFCLSGVSVTDNYSTLKKEDINITIEKVEEEVWEEYIEEKVNEGEISQEISGDTPTLQVESDVSGDKFGYLITYEVSDGVGNSASTTVVFHY